MRRPREIGMIVLLATALGACSLIRDFGTFHEVSADGSVGPDGALADGCVPAPETCNGRDDDCNGEVDDAPTECTIANGTAACIEGACGFGSCDPLFGDCDRDGTSCETDLSAARMNCGACGEICGATEACVAGVCRQGEVEWAEVASTLGEREVEAGYLVRTGASDLFVAGNVTGIGSSDQLEVGARRSFIGSAVPQGWIARASAGTGGVVEIWAPAAYAADSSERSTSIVAATALEDRAVFAFNNDISTERFDHETLPPLPDGIISRVVFLSLAASGPKRYGILDDVTVEHLASHAGTLMIAGRTYGGGELTGGPLGGELTTIDLTAPGGFIATMNEALELTSARRFGFMSPDAFAVAADGRPFVGGTVRDTTTVETAEGTLEVGEGGEGLFGPVDMESGRFEWLWRFECPQPMRAPPFQSIAGAAVGEDGGIFALVNCDGSGPLRTVGMDPPVEVERPPGAVSVLIRFEPDGTMSWAHAVGRDVGQLRSRGSPTARELYVRGDQVYVQSPSGTTATSIDLGAGPLDTAGASYVLGAFDASTGALRWGRVFGSAAPDSPRDIVVDADRIYGTGFFSGRIDFGEGVECTPRGTRSGLFFSFVP